MRIAILQHDIVWASPADNMRHLEGLLDKAPEADLYVVAEMWATGFSTDPTGMAEGHRASLEWMACVARSHNAAVAGSIAMEENGQYRNRFYFVKPDGVTQYYDKRHLFAYGGEDKHFTRGEQRVVVEWLGVRFLLEVCYDLRFPVWSRNRGDYDAALYVASWPSSRIEAWDTLLKARAIENQCYVIGVNRVGKDPNCEYAGASAIIDAYGRQIAKCDNNEECVAKATLDVEALQAFRQKFPVLRDRDEFKL